MIQREAEGVTTAQGGASAREDRVRARSGMALSIPSTWRWLLPILGAVFVAEFGVMLALPFIPLGEGLLSHAVVDSAVLIALLSPFMARLDRRRSRAEAEAARLAQAQATLIQDLQRALAEVRTLSGLLPICSACKKIRDDEGYWNQIEGDLRRHSAVEITHGICPECAVTLYGQYLDGEDQAP